MLNDNNRSPLLLLRNLDQIHRNLRRRDPDTDTVDEAAHNQHPHTVTTGLDSGAQQPPKASKGYGITATDAIGYGARHDGADDGTAGQSGADATLGGAGWIVEIIDVLLGSDDGGDGGDVEAEAGDV